MTLLDWLLITFAVAYIGYMASWYVLDYLSVREMNREQRESLAEKRRAIQRTRQAVWAMRRGR